MTCDLLTLRSSGRRGGRSRGAIAEDGEGEVGEEAMTVGELIELLVKFPEDSEVVRDDFEEGACTITEVEVKDGVKLWPGKGNMRKVVVIV